MANYPTNDLILDADRVDFEILFCNLEGRKDAYNTRGDRSFRLKINDKEFAKQLADEGWNIKIYTPKNEEYDPYYYMDVKTKFRVDSENVYQDPEIHRVNAKNDILCGPQNMHDIDAAFKSRKVQRVDLVINPYYWQHPGMGKGEGVTAYIREMWIEVQESPFASRYSDRNSNFANDENLPWE